MQGGKMFKLCKMTIRVGFAALMALAMVLASSYAPSQVLADVTAPSLGTAESFAVLGAEGVTNVPTSSIWGDVGLYPAAGSYYDGLTAVEVDGTIYATDATGPDGAVEDPVLLQSAQAANTAAYGVLAAATPITDDLSGEDLGGKTLTPGVYRFSSDAGLTGTLTLDAEDNPDAVFIFQIGSALTTASGSSVVMTNAPEGFCNVWWQVGSSATLGTDSHFKGNILALTSISLKTDASLEGRAFVQTGAVTMESNDITMPVCYDTTPSETGILQIFKFNDLNEDGVYDPPEETPLANWHYTITGPEEYNESGYIDDSGLLTLEGLTPGEYTVTETVQAGWNVTTDNPQIGTVVAGDVEILAFGNRQPVGGAPPPTVGGEVYPINAVKLLMPWIVLFTAVLAGAIIIARRRLRSYG
jgi:hypothetical protein